MARVFENDKRNLRDMIIVSMTSFPGRISLVSSAYEHFILNQTLKCDKYVLWLSRAEFGGEKTADEIGLDGIVNKGLEIHWCDEDSKIHIRHNSLKLWPDAYNLMIDEDILYPSTYTEELINASRTYPNCVISYFACFEIFTGYRKFELPRFKKPSIRNKFNGGLVCFPPNTYPQICFKFESIRDVICPYHDETWVNLFLKLLGVKVFGLHNIKWDIFESNTADKNIINLHDYHKRMVEKYSYDVTQFNQVLYVFPELMRVYKKAVFGLYFFHDKGEIYKYSQKYKQIHQIDK